MSSELWTLALVVFGPLILGKVTPFLSRTPKVASSPAATKARISPLGSAFQFSIFIVTILAVLISIINLVPVQYGLDLIIPAETISTLQSALYTLYSSPSPSIVEPLRLSFRGGYKGDIFLALKSPITIPTATLRSLLNTAPSLLSLGFTGSESDLEALIARLSSYDGRKLYLVVGKEVMTECAFCHGGKDYMWFALPRLMIAYAWRLGLVGYLTGNPTDSIAVMVNGFGRLVRTGSITSPTTNPQQMEQTRQSWRGYTVATLLGMLTVESLVIYDTGSVKVGLGRWNHWHANLHIVRQVAFFILVLIIYFFPSQPQPSVFAQTAHLLQLTQSRVEKSIANLEAAGLARTVVIRDEGLRERAVQWHEKESKRTRGYDEVMEMAGRKGVETAKMKEVCKEAVKGVWREADSFNDQWERQVAAAMAKANEEETMAVMAAVGSDEEKNKQAEPVAASDKEKQPEAVSSSI